MPTGPAPDGRPRSLADDLRARDDEALVALLRERPDLRSPVPADLAALAARATTRPSVQRALDHLDRFTLQVVDAAVALPDHSSVSDVQALLAHDPAEALATLRRQVLVYGPDDDLTVARTVREVVGDPAGLGPPAEQALRAYGPARLAALLTDLDLTSTGDPIEDASQVAALLADDAALGALLDAADDAVRDVLAALTWGSPTGRLDRAARPVQKATAQTPVEWLLARGLLVATDPRTVVLPREVGLHLRGGRVHAQLEASPPEPVLTAVDATRTDHTAAAAAATFVRLVDELLESWATDPPKALRTGGLGVRDRSRSAAILEVDQEQLNFIVETAHAAGLLASGGDVEEVWLPTTVYDGWRAETVAARWWALASAWLTTMRVAGLSGSKDNRGKVLAPLGPELARSIAPGVRRDVLDALLAVPPGRATTAESVADRLRWQTPRLFGRLREGLVGWTVHESELLGLAAGGALGRHGRLLVQGDDDGAVAALDALLPQPLDHVLLQADLTAVAPGPLVGELAQQLGVLADVESRGGATVYRFTDASIRRALDVGWSSADVLELLTAHSRTPVPQPLAYLVEDVARRHGRVRVGVASAYLRCDDETTLTEMLGDRRTATLRLRRLAPTVLAAQAPVDVVLAKLRELGHAPAAEGPDGDILVRRPDARRAPSPRRLPSPPATAELPTAVLGAAVRAIRAGDRASTAVKRPAGVTGGIGGPPSSPTVDVLAILQQAAAAGETLWIGYVDAHGQATQRLIEPVVVEGGFVEAFDHLRQDVRRFAVHRITGAAAIDQSAS
ncbi:MAG: helicase-associated domain-containing protein [Actinomycetes bacterium]